MKPLEPTPAALSRRRFLTRLGTGLSLVGLGGISGLAAARGRKEQRVWQIDPFVCTQCGRCTTHCVLDRTAVRVVHDFPMCGYCRLCFGFFQTNPAALDEGAENQMCPTGAIKRTFVEVPYYEYTIDEDLCIGCGKCVKGCNRFGNGSLYLQVRQNLCVQCNECSIAVACPANALIRLPKTHPYVIKREGKLPV